MSNAYEYVQGDSKERNWNIIDHCIQICQRIVHSLKKFGFISETTIDV